MYTFQPLVDTNWDCHYGFYFIGVVAVLFMMFVLALWKEDECNTSTVFIWLALCVGLVTMAHNVSYQPQKVYANTKVTGEFVQFNPEAWVEKSGKSTTVNRHTFVTYRVGNNLVILEANLGVTYPKTVVLYKN